MWLVFEGFYLAMDKSIDKGFARTQIIDFQLAGGYDSD
jgi:hypothetical protein